MEEVGIDLGRSRDQLQTRANPRFGQLRSQIYALIKNAKHQTGALRGMRGRRTHRSLWRLIHIYRYSLQMRYRVLLSSYRETVRYCIVDMSKVLGVLSNQSS